jgi:putative transcriptional regulator
MSDRHICQAEKYVSLKNISPCGILATFEYLLEFFRRGFMTIRIAINEMLDKRGKTAYWLAKETGLSHTVIGKLRHGQNQSITFETLDAICEALDCGVEEILVREKPGRKTRKG